MSDLKASIAVNLTGDLAARARKNGEALERMGRRGTRAMRGFNQAAGRALKGLGGLGNRYTALAAGFITGAGARAMMKTEVRLERLGVQSKKSSREITALWDEINKRAEFDDIKVDPKEILTAIEDIVEKTGDLGFARNNLEAIGRAIQATGAGGSAIGQVVAEFQKMGLIKPDQVAEAFDILNVQGKEGAFTLQNLAALGPRVMAAYSASGRGGLEAIRDMGAALQVIRMGTGSSEQAATAFEALMRTLQDADKIKMLQKGGIQIFDAEALKKGQEVLRPINELMKEIIQRVDGKATALSRIFDAEAMRAFLSASSEYKRTGKIGSLDKFMGVKASGETAADSRRIAQTAEAAWEKTTSKVMKKMEDSLMEPVKKFSEAVDKAVDGDLQGTKFALRGLSRSVFPDAFFPKDEPGGLASIRAQKERELAQPPEGKLVVEVQAKPGTKATVKHLEGRNLEVDNGLIMGH